MHIRVSLTGPFLGSAASDFTKYLCTSPPASLNNWEKVKLKVVKKKCTIGTYSLISAKETGQYINTEEYRQLKEDYQRMWQAVRLNSPDAMLCGAGKSGIAPLSGKTIDLRGANFFGANEQETDGVVSYYVQLSYDH